MPRLGVTIHDAMMQRIRGAALVRSKSCHSPACTDHTHGTEPAGSSVWKSLAGSSHSWTGLCVVDKLGSHTR